MCPVAYKMPSATSMKASHIVPTSACYDESPTVSASGVRLPAAVIAPLLRVGCRLLHRAARRAGGGGNPSLHSDHRGDAHRHLRPPAGVAGSGAVHGEV